MQNTIKRYKRIDYLLLTKLRVFRFLFASFRERERDIKREREKVKKKETEMGGGVIIEAYLIGVFLHLSLRSASFRQKSSRERCRIPKKV